MVWAPLADGQSSGSCAGAGSIPSLAELDYPPHALSPSRNPATLTMLPLLAPPGESDPAPPVLYPVYVVLAGLGLLAFLGVGMVASRKRRREHGQLWFPEGFKSSEPSKKKRREPVGEDSVRLK